MLSTALASPYRPRAAAAFLASGLLLLVTISLAPMPAAAQTGNSGPDLTLVKDGTLVLGGTVGMPGDLINYTFAVSDASVECVSDITVTDPLVPVITCPGGMPISPPPDTCTGSYAITQADIDAGFVANTATATGFNGCREQTEIVTSDHREPIPRAPSIGLTKDGMLEVGEEGTATPGDLINYSLTATNTGNVTLSNVEFSDPVVEMITCPSGQPIATLAPGASETCTGTYAITQADIDAGFKENTATVSAEDGSIVVTVAAAVPITAQAMVQVLIPQGASISVTKNGVLDLGANGVADPGDLINYSFLVENTGNVTLTNVAVTDPLVSPVTCPGGNPIPTLAPAASVTCTGSYAITAADIAAGNVVNTADAAGMDPAAQPVLAGDTDTVMMPATVPTVPALALLVLTAALAITGMRLLRKRATG